MKKQFVEFANLICRFGENAVLLDHFGLVSRALTVVAKSHRRKYGKTSYFFHRCSVMQIDDDGLGPVPVIAGRIVKDTILESQQQYQGGRLARGSMTMESAPSSFFVLILHSHRLLYVREMASSPTLEQLALTLMTALTSEWDEYIRADENWSTALRGPTTLGERKRQLPRPRVTVVPFASKDEIDEQVDRFDLLNEIRVSFNGTNHSIDNDDFFRRFHGRAVDLGAERSKMSFLSKIGLRHAVAKRDVKDAKESGNQKVTMQGTDDEGNKLRIDDEDFQLKRPLAKSIGKQVPAAANKLYKLFLAVLQLGLVPTDQDQEAQLTRARNAAKDL